MKKLTRRHLLWSAMGAAVGKAMGRNVSTESETVHEVIVSTFVKDDWRPDGDLSKESWTRAVPVQFNQDARSDARYPEFTTKVASCWTAKYLYLAFWCPYQTLNIYEGEDAAVERWRLWERDVVEVFIQPAPQMPSHYYEFEVAPNNQWLDLEIHLAPKPSHNAGWNSGFEHAARINPTTHIWTVEMRIPAASMNTEIRPGGDWRVNFYRCDGPGDDRTMHLMCWGRLPFRGPGASFHQPASFGILRFSDALTAR